MSHEDVIGRRVSKSRSVDHDEDVVVRGLGSGSPAGSTAPQTIILTITASERGCRTRGQGPAVTWDVSIRVKCFYC
ncbi:hypothetical protein M3J09_002244 [Ascochyta lentis]